VTRGVLPRPRFLEHLSGSVTWSSPLRVVIDAEWRGVLATFAEDLAFSVGWNVIEVSPNEPHELEVVRLPELGPEEYQLSVDAVTRVEASTAAGVAYALTTIRQLGPAEWWSTTRLDLDRAELPRAVVQDAPRYSWRGAHLDVARHFFDADTVCRLIDQLAAHKLSRLHLHLNDDQGWRVEVPTWPRLTEVGSIRRSTPIGHENEGLDDGVSYGGYYRASDVARIREHARRRFVQLVPEIDLPGHAQAAIAAYPELGNVAEPLEVWTRWGISEHVLNVSSHALAFAEDVALYVAGLFPGSPVHIGGDECPTTEWEESPAALATMLEHGFRGARELQGLFTQRVTAALQREGREVLAWDEVLDAEVPSRTVIVAWRSVEKGVDAARRGLDVIMAPMQFLYFDWLSSDREGEPVAVAPQPAVTTWEKVYEFDVVPDGLAPEFIARLRGAQAQLWSEYIDTPERLDYMAFPRLSAFSEVAWGTTTSLEEFRPRLIEHLERLHAMGVRYRPLDDE
jgi:hexosaminidase